MRIKIEDDFDNELESEYKSIDDDSIIGNGALSNSNKTIIEVNATKVDESNMDENNINDNFEYTNEEANVSENKDKKESKTYNLDNGFSLELQGARIVGDTYDANENESSENKLSESKLVKNKSNEEDKNNLKEYLNENISYSKSYYMKKKRNVEIKGKIRVVSKLGDRNGSNISDAKINLYALNGLSPKFISSKVTDKNGVVIFDNLSEGSYRVIEIVNRKYFEKPTYIQWNEVTINDELQEENIIVVNRVKRHSR